MTKPTLTAERIAWFARYYLKNPTWGVFHVALCDGNFECPAALEAELSPTGGRLLRDQWPEDLREAAEWFDALTQAQRRRLGRQARGRAKLALAAPDAAPDVT